VQLEILTYPDPLLKRPSVEVEQFDSELHQLLDDMYETMVAKGGVGLAAIQVGIPKQVLIINLPNENDEQPKEQTLEVINPKIISLEGKQKSEEGCLSVPGYYEQIDRAVKIELSYFDREGNEQKMVRDDFMAIALQHEIEHLSGKLFIENFSILKRKKFEKQWKRRK